MLSIVLNISYICALKKPDPIKQNLASEEGDEKLIITSPKTPFL
jgi:hypothetical protein